MHILKWLFLLVCLCFFAEARVALAASLPPSFSETQVASGLDPTSMAFAPDGRLFVCEKNGTVRIISNGALLPTPFLTLTVDSYNERGMQGIAFDPNFESNGYVYIYYAALTPVTHTQVSRFTASGNLAVPGSETVIIALPASSGTVHNAGALHFYNGKLFIGAGEFGAPSNSQTLANPLGKILCLNPDGTVPSDNPFVNTPGAHPAIWAYGLRNPYTFAFQPGTGRLFINDVGGGSFEEINLGQAGANYGWATREGPGGAPSFTDPYYSYNHSNGCAITGGVFYNPSVVQFPSVYVGRYFFADYCNGTIYTIHATNSADVQVFATNVDRAIDFDVAPDGALYYLARGGLGGGSQEDNTSSGDGAVYRVVFSGTQAPSIAVQPSSTLVPVGENASFTVGASGTAPFTYRWRKNFVTIPGGTSPTLSFGPVVVGDNNAIIDCVVTNGFGFATTQGAILSVTTNSRPTATILTPTGAPYQAGQLLAFSGSATDAEDGALPSSAFSWSIQLHHDTHTHPALAAVSGISSGQYLIPVIGESSTNVFYRVFLTVVDSGGLTRTVFRDVPPVVATVTVATSPPGLTLIFDGKPFTAPFTFSGVAGITRNIGLANPTVSGTSAYRFSNWSDGGAAVHVFSTPATNSTLTATFVADGNAFGSGITGAYYSLQYLTFNSPATLTRVDETIDFDWGEGSPAPQISPSAFTVRWTGQIQPQFSEPYTFHTRTDDGVRLWVDNQLIIDQFDYQAVTQWTGTIPLIAGRKYDIKMEYFEDGGDAEAHLSWSSPSVGEGAILKDRLFPTATNVSIVASDSTAKEGTSNTASYSVSRTGPTTYPLEVIFSTSGTASYPADFALSAPTALIPAGQTSAVFTLSPVNDTLVEGTEATTFTLQPGFAYALSGTVSANISILDSPAALWKVSNFGSTANAQSARAADSADWDMEGTSNLVEYALGTDPVAAGAKPTISNAVENVSGVNYLTITYTRPSTAPTDITYRPEVTGDLNAGPWSAAVLVPGYPVINGNGTATLKYRDTVSSDVAPLRFIRLRITRP